MIYGTVHLAQASARCKAQFGLTSGMTRGKVPFKGQAAPKAVFRRGMKFDNFQPHSSGTLTDKFDQLYDVHMLFLQPSE